MAGKFGRNWNEGAIAYFKLQKEAMKLSVQHNDPNSGQQWD
jgi:hypothetical protein